MKLWSTRRRNEEAFRDASLDWRPSAARAGQLHERGEVVMAVTVFVGNVSRNTTESGLSELFEGRGFLVNKVIIPLHRSSHQPRGYAFVSLADRRQADDAIRQLHGAELDGRSLNLRPAMASSSAGQQTRGHHLETLSSSTDARCALRCLMVRLCAR